MKECDYFCRWQIWSKSVFFNVENLWADYSIMKHASCIQFTKSVYVLVCLDQFVQSQAFSNKDYLLK